MNQVPIVIDEGSLLHGFPHFFRRRGRRRCGRDVEPLHGLGCPAAAVVVCVVDADRAIGEECRGDGGQLVFRVVGVGPRAVGDETAIGSVGERDRRRAGGSAPYHLVHLVVGEGVGYGIVAKEQMVADVVVGVREEVGANGGRDNFAAVVIGESGVNGQDARCPSGTSYGAGERVKDVGIGINSGGIERGGAVRHEAASVIVAVNDATDRIAVRHRDRVAVAVAGNVGVGNGEGTSGGVRGRDARKVAVGIVAVTDSTSWLVVNGEGETGRAVERIVCAKNVVRGRDKARPSLRGNYTVTPNVHLAKK